MNERKLPEPLPRVGLDHLTRWICNARAFNQVGLEHLTDGSVTPEPFHWVGLDHLSRWICYTRALQSGLDLTISLDGFVYVS